VKPDEQRADVDGISVGELDGPDHAFIAAQGAVLGAEVLEYGALGGHHEPGMPARHRRCIEADFHVGITPDDVFPKRQLKMAVAPFQPARWPFGPGLAMTRLDGRLSAECVAEPVRGSNPHRRGTPIVKRFANLGDEMRKVALDHEGMRPETFLQSRLGEGFGTIYGERLQQLKCFGRQMNLAAVARQLPTIEVEIERAEANLHDAVPGRPPLTLSDIYQETIQGIATIGLNGDSTLLLCSVPRRGDRGRRPRARRLRRGETQ